MIVAPANDRDCLARLSALAIEESRGDDAETYADRYRTPQDFAAYLRSLPQRDDDGSSTGAHTVQCDVAQRVNVWWNNAPNCVERAVAYLAVAERLDPRTPRRLVTVDFIDESGRRVRHTNVGELRGGAWLPIDLQPEQSAPPRLVRDYEPASADLWQLLPRAIGPAADAVPRNGFWEGVDRIREPLGLLAIGGRIGDEPARTWRHSNFGPWEAFVTDSGASRFVWGDWGGGPSYTGAPGPAPGTPGWIRIDYTADGPAYLYASGNWHDFPDGVIRYRRTDPAVPNSWARSDLGNWRARVADGRWIVWGVWGGGPGYDGSTGPAAGTEGWIRVDNVGGDRVGYAFVSDDWHAFPDDAIVPRNASGAPPRNGWTDWGRPVLGVVHGVSTAVLTGLAGQGGAQVAGYVGEWQEKGFKSYEDAHPEEYEQTAAPELGARTDPAPPARPATQSNGGARAAGRQDNGGQEAQADRRPSSAWW